MTTFPILYSFRRCPFAMRARLAISSAGVQCELREILLRDKAPELLQASPKGTVPVVVDGNKVIDQSLDIMVWALGQNDPEGLLDQSDKARKVIAELDGPFKTALDRYKYANRYQDADPLVERANAARFLQDLDTALKGSAWLYGDRPRLADLAILPFVRQFAHVDLTWFEGQDWPDLIRWLSDFKASDRFQGIMRKSAKWVTGDPVTLFPDNSDSSVA